MSIPISFASARRTSRSREAANKNLASAPAVEVATVVCNLELELKAPDSEFKEKQKPLVDFL